MRTTIVACLIAAILPATALAQSADLDALFASADKNGDGLLSAAELKADALSDFGSLDSNGNGSLDSRELAAFFAKEFSETGHTPDQAIVNEMTRQAIARWDRNGDGVLSRDEYGNGVVADTFEHADGNRDKGLSKQEMRGFRGDAPR